LQKIFKKNINISLNINTLDVIFLLSIIFLKIVLRIYVVYANLKDGNEETLTHKKNHMAYLHTISVTAAAFFLDRTKAWFQISIYRHFYNYSIHDISLKSRHICSLYR
jgi:hypothetical protein